MSITRRRFARLFSGSAAAVGLAGLVPSLAGAAGYADMPNVFFSPHGKPFRAKDGAPYPVVDWFAQANKSGDGKLTHPEFMADAEAFFKVLDLNAAGILDPYDISIYEHLVAPEILGFRVAVSALDRGPVQVGPDGAVLWLAQGGPFDPGGPGQPQLGPPDSGIDPGGGRPNEPSRPHGDSEIGVGAAPFSLMHVPEPVTAADPDFVTRGAVRKAAFLSHADENFTALDPDDTGYLTLANLPKTPVQELIERAHHGRRTGRP